MSAVLPATVVSAPALPAARAPAPFARPSNRLPPRRVRPRTSITRQTMNPIPTRQKTADGETPATSSSMSTTAISRACSATRTIPPVRRLLHCTYRPQTACKKKETVWLRLNEGGFHPVFNRNRSRLQSRYIAFTFFYRVSSIDSPLCRMTPRMPFASNRFTKASASCSINGKVL